MNLVKVSANRIGSGIAQRDEAIKVGARGASKLIYTKGRHSIKGNERALAVVKTLTR